MDHSPRLFIVAFCLVSLSLAGAGCSGSSDTSLVEPINDVSGGVTAITKSDALADHWYGIAPYITGTEGVEAYSHDSGSTYYLDATFGSGYVDSLDNGYGDTLYFTAELGADGEASGDDNNGNTWDFTVDLASSPMISAAVEEWAADEGYEIE
ncbi:TPA: hypothetical protein DEP96_02715 [Candidatus Uhrbacteria bacterium]|nr:hypothetical protein [Candidatus Uhrbacteria bacterium]